MLKKEQFLLSVTTTAEWKGKIREIDELDLEKAALFPTFLELEQRKEFYALLEKTCLKRVPFCHLRSDMEFWELDYLIEKWKCSVFNLHTQREYPFQHDYLKYKSMLYIENVYFDFDEKEISSAAGICLDFSHMENDRVLHPEKFEKRKKVLEKYGIGCNHISAVRQKPYKDENGYMIVSSHFMKSLEDLNYLKHYPHHYFSQFCALELENSLKEQIEAIEYILKNVN